MTLVYPHHLFKGPVSKQSHSEVLGPGLQGHSSAPSRSFSLRCPGAALEPEVRARSAAGSVEGQRGQSGCGCPQRERRPAMRGEPRTARARDVF